MRPSLLLRGPAEWLCLVPESPPARRVHPAGHTLGFLGQLLSLVAVSAALQRSPALAHI